METLKLYRKRYIPNELTPLTNDQIIRRDEERILTKWETLKPRTDFTHGESCYFLKRGFKVSKFLDRHGSLVHWYCDIVEFEWDKPQNACIVHDLLIDIVVEKNGFVKVLDVEEIARALDEGLLSSRQTKKALTLAGELLALIYAGKFHTLTAVFDL